MPNLGVDPLDGVRDEQNATIDVLCAGSVFFDIVFTGLTEMPRVGTEVWAPGMGSSPGGIANMAVALSRLGLRTSLAAAFGNDVYGDYCWDTLSIQEKVDLSPSRRFDNWHSPVTASIAALNDRTMFTHGHEAPLAMDDMLAVVPAARACYANLELGEQRWIREAQAAGSLVFADVGWDATEKWSPEALANLQYCHAFLPNAVEAMALTKTDNPRRALWQLADRVPLAVVTCGSDGVLAVDGTTGEYAKVEGLRVPAIDATGAGDVFGAGCVVGTLAGWPLAQRLRFANMCAALSVQHFGGSLAAPGWCEVAEWWQQTRAEHADGCAMITGYEFLAELLPSYPRQPVRRAAATVVRHVC